MPSCIYLLQHRRYCHSRRRECDYDSPSIRKVLLFIDGTTGEVFEGEAKLISPTITKDLELFLGWADEIRLMAKRDGLKEKGSRVRRNVDQSEDAKVARKLGAEGIGLCRTEHMFFEAEKLELFREMIVAADLDARKAALKKLLPMQKKDFVGIFKAMNGLTVTVRLLDPPLHEFLPNSAKDIKELAVKLGTKPAELTKKVESLHEMNPMLGHRGCRLGITYPEIYDMQVEAIMSAACEVAKKNIAVEPEIMIPLVGTAKELEILRNNAVAVIAEVFKAKKMKVKHKIGTMI